MSTPMPITRSREKPGCASAAASAPFTELLEAQHVVGGVLAREVRVARVDEDTLLARRVLADGRAELAPVRAVDDQGPHRARAVVDADRERPRHGTHSCRGARRRQESREARAGETIGPAGNTGWRNASHGTQERDLAPQGARAGGAGPRGDFRARRRLPGDRAGLGLRRHRAQQPHQRRARSAPGASRAATTCRGSGSTTRRGSWRSATSTAGASRTRRRWSTATTPRRRASRTTASRATRLPELLGEQGRGRGRDQHARPLARAHHDRRRSRPARTSTCRSRPRSRSPRAAP